MQKPSMLLFCLLMVSHGFSLDPNGLHLNGCTGVDMTKYIQRTKQQEQEKRAELREEQASDGQVTLLHIHDVQEGHEVGERTDS